MKQIGKQIYSALVAGTVLGMALFNAKAAVTYWDPAGVVTVPYTGDLTGTWENNVWSTAAGGTASPGAWVESTAACFGVGTGNGTPPFTVTINANHTVAGFFNGNLAPNSCNVTLVGPGILTLKSANENAFEAITSSDGAVGMINISNVLAGSSTALLTCEGGTGQLFLHGANTWAGGTELGYSGLGFGGLLWFNSSSSFGTGKIIVGNTSGGVCAILSDVSTNITLTNPFVWTNYVKTPLGINFVPQSDTGTITSSGAWSFHSVITNANIYVNDSPTKKVIISGVMSGGSVNGFINKGNVGILELSGANTYNNTTTVSNGVLQAGNAKAIPNGSGKGDLWIYNPGIFDVNGFSVGCNGLQGDGLIDNTSTNTGTLTFGNNNAAVSFSGTIQNTQGILNLVKAGTGSLTLSGNNTFSGNVTINGGSATVPGGNTQIPQTAGLTLGSGVTLDVQGNSMTLTNLSGRGSIVNSGATLTITGNFVTNGSQVTYSGFSGNVDNGSLIKNGSEAMAVRGTNNNFSGGIQLNSGALAVGAGPNRLLVGGGAILSIGDGAVFELSGSPGESIGQLSGTGFIDLEGGSLIVNTPIGNTYGGVIRDSDLPGSSTVLGHGLRGYYYNHQDFTSLGAIRDDAQINFPDLTQTSNLPPGILQGTNICVRWIGQVLAPVDGTYTFNVNSDDGCRLWVNGQCIVDNWITKGAGNSTGTVTLSANTRYDIIVEYFQQSSGASCKLMWTPPGDTVTTLIPSDDLLLPGVGSVVKDGAGSLQLTATSSYSGTTIVKGGTLEASTDGALGNGNVTVQDGATLTLDSGSVNNYIADSADLILTASATVQLNFTGTDTVRSLSLDGGATYQVAGTYGAAGSGAQHVDSHFSGSGLIRVAGLPSTTTLGSSIGSTVYGSTVTFTGVAHGSGATPTGTITFFDGANALGTVAVDGSGTAVLTFSDLSVTGSPHSVTAVYNGDATYSPSTSSAVPQTVTPITLTGVTGSTKVYDQTISAPLNLTNLTGILPVDSNFVQIASGYTANYNDKNVGTGKPVTASGITLTGGAAGNYTIASTASTIGNITPKLLTVTNSTASNKVYDGTVTATVSVSAAGIQGISTNVIFAGDDVATNITTATATGVFSDPNVGTGKTVTVTVQLTGADAGNYLATGAPKANITIATSALGLTSSANPANAGDNVSFTATASAATGAGTPTGNVIFLNNGVAFATVALSGGAANSGAITTLPQGTNTITAQYAGSANFVGSTNTLQQVINASAQPPTMTISNSAGSITISWTGVFNLQSVNALQSSGTPWQTIPGATSPYTTPITNAAQFYRLSN